MTLFTTNIKLPICYFGTFRLCSLRNLPTAELWKACEDLYLGQNAVTSVCRKAYLRSTNDRNIATCRTYMMKYITEAWLFRWPNYI